MYRNSGKDYNDLGRFDDCEKMDNFRYILALVPHVFPIPMALGLCVPAVCTVQDFNSFKPYLVSAINNIIPEFFSGIKGFDSSTQLNIDDLQFNESKVENAEVTKFDGGALLTILIIVFFVLFVLISSVFLWLKKKEAIREEEERISLASRSNSETRSKRTDGIVRKDRDSNGERRIESPRKNKKSSRPTFLVKLMTCFSI